MSMKHYAEPASTSNAPQYGEPGSHWLKEYDASAATAGHSKAPKGHYEFDEPVSSDPPPAYTPSPDFTPSAEVDIPDSALVLLQQYDTVFLVDDSTTMKEVDRRGFLQRGPAKTRWQLACATLVKYGKIASHYDADGIDIHFLNYVPDKSMQVKNTHLKTEAEITTLFQYARPNGPTHIGRRLNEICADYLEELKVCKQRRTAPPKPRNYIVITDGAPTSPDEVINFLKSTAMLLEDELKSTEDQLGFQFVQIGGDAEATEFLNYLDTSAKFQRDIVDTIKNKGAQKMKSKLRGLMGMDETAIMCRKLLLGGISRFHDTKGDVLVKR